jgi:lipopolysaccharide/colanic/teichoic acid biosynthesis glycosyltransferase
MRKVKSVATFFLITSVYGIVVWCVMYLLLNVILKLDVSNNILYAGNIVGCLIGAFVYFMCRRELL